MPFSRHRNATCSWYIRRNFLYTYGKIGLTLCLLLSPLFDTPDDLAFIEALHERSRARAGEASLADLLLLLEREPDLNRINAHVTQKAIGQASSGGLARKASPDHKGLRASKGRRVLKDPSDLRASFVVHGMG